MEEEEQNSEEEELEEEQPEEDSEDEEEESTEEEGKEEDAPSTITIDGKEYTEDQVREMQKKSGQYDEILPDYTRKSQKVAEYEKGKEKGQEQPETLEKAPYENPEWKPKDMAELGRAIKMAEERGHKRALADLQKMESDRANAKQQVDDFVADIKKTDKDFDEDDFFQYAVKHKFPVDTVKDLEAVYSAYSETQAAAAEGEKRGRKGKAARSKDKVNVPKGGEKGDPNFDDIHAQGGSIHDRMEKGLERVTGKKR